MVFRSCLAISVVGNKVVGHGGQRLRTRFKQVGVLLDGAARVWESRSVFVVQSSIGEIDGGAKLHGVARSPSMDTGNPSNTTVSMIVGGSIPIVIEEDSSGDCVAQNPNSTNVSLNLPVNKFFVMQEKSGIGPVAGDPVDGGDGKLKAKSSVFERLTGGHKAYTNVSYASLLKHFAVRGDKGLEFFPLLEKGATRVELPVA
ncbi:hypothetical protein L6452_15230 [Arctium lappa]|uniref:Uncharacterized protein n=1 Tax=Arctium lappa TaxID=4217 RepID=A0ACB9CN91_ARCLA|nr:hypothetical protein L6452_15230 [Arctium lappa]